MKYDTKTLLSEFARWSEAILKDNLLGIYLHGSAVMGCFNPEKSDIDLIIVVNDRLSDDVKQAYMEMVVELSSLGPAKGIEMSIVPRDACKPFVYPTPFELHFSVGHLEWYRSNPEDYIQKMKGTDRDLAAHFTIIRQRGRCLYGLPIDDVFGEIPSSAYMDSIRNDVCDAADDIVRDTMYLTLNLARVLAYCKEGLVLSKKEGGEWALNNLPDEYHALVRDALREYQDGADISYDTDCAVRYAKDLLNRISVYCSVR